MAQVELCILSPEGRAGEMVQLEMEAPLRFRIPGAMVKEELYTAEPETPE
jgi:hypothetical protein